MTLPSLLSGLLISKTAIMEATAIQTADVAIYRPGHTLVGYKVELAVV